MSSSQSESPINKAIRSLEATEANLDKLERLLGELKKLIPNGIVFGSDLRYEELCRSYQDILDALPSIDGWKPAATPVDLNDLARWRFDARDTDEPSLMMAVEDSVDEPGREVAEFRHRMNKKRRLVIRRALAEVIIRAENALGALRGKYDNLPVADSVVDPAFEELKKCVQEIETMLGSSLPRPERWADLRRHLGFGNVQDLLDIVRLDWPKVSEGLSAGLYGENEPVPVEIEDLGALADSQPGGSVATQLMWDRLSAEDFERLIFSLISNERGYENPQWLTRTNAPDRGRDLSVTRVIQDPLSGVTRRRVIIQCKHWNSRSVNPGDVGELKEQMLLWDSPRVDVLVIATSGRFTSDAVAVIEKSNNDDRALKIEMWPESHLELLLAQRSALIAEFKLR